MMISSADPGLLREERELIEQLPLHAARALELGCGNGGGPRLLARSGKFASILALEVDRVQHGLNLARDDLPSVRFGLGGAEDIPAADASADAVFLLGPWRARVHLGTGLRGRLQRDPAPLPRRGAGARSRLRRHLPGGRCRPAGAGVADFFLAPVRYRDFAEFERKVVNATHAAHRLSLEVAAPLRVDLLQKI
jgi:hypothetical protein